MENGSSNNESSPMTYISENIHEKTDVNEHLASIYELPQSKDDDAVMKKNGTTKDDSECCETYILSVEPSAEDLSSKNIEDGNEEIISTADLTPAQQNAMAMNSDPNAETTINQVWFTSKVDKSYLKNNKGQLWRTGMWSKDEISTLENNISEYCKANNIADPAVVIFNMNKDERKDFYRVIAKGLNRPLFSIYRRVIRMYDNKNHMGRYSPEEMAKLKDLRAKHGKDWQAIGLEMGRSPASIKDKCRLMKDNCNQGKWLPEEERRLSNAVYDLAQAFPGETVYSGLSWSAIAAKVATRTEKQCRTKWLNYLNWKESGGTEWTRDDDIFLIYKIKSMTTQDESAIDWALLSEGWPSVRSPQWLRGKWWTLKQLVPSKNQKNFQEVCDFLYNLVGNVVRKEGEPPNESKYKKLATVETTPTQDVPECTQVSIPETYTTSEVPSSDSYSLIYVPISNINSGQTQTICFTHLMQQLNSGEETLLIEGAADGQQIMMQPISEEILESVNKSAGNIAAGEHVVIASSNGLNSLQTTDSSSVLAQTDSMEETCSEVISNVVIKSSDGLLSTDQNFSTASDEMAIVSDVNTDSSKLIHADPMLGATSHITEIIHETSSMNQELVHTSQHPGST